MDVPRHRKIRALGYVDENRKQALLRDASVLVQPSRFESLSLVLLEAWLVGTPVLVNGGCSVLREQVVEAGGGLYYENGDEFREALTYLLSRPRIGRALAGAGRAFTAENYSWEAIERKYLAVMERVGATKT
jgi:glycosyltransferase involved in cell wall biosynthesis